MNRTEKMMVIANVDNDMDFLNKYEKLIWRTVSKKRSQLMTKINNSATGVKLFDDSQDLFNDGVIVLFESLDKFNVQLKKVNFTTYFVNNFRFWLNNNFKTNYTGIKVTTRGMQKQRNLYKEAELEMLKGNINKADELYSKANFITGKFFSLKPNEEISDMDKFMDNLEHKEQEYDTTVETLRDVIDTLNSDDKSLITMIYGIGRDKVSIGNISKELGLDRSTIYRNKIRIIETIKEGMDNE